MAGINSLLISILTKRSLGYIASTLEAGLGFLQVFWNPNKMTLHDKIGETVVINIRKKNE